MPARKNKKELPAEPQPQPELTLTEAQHLRRTFRLSSLLTRADGITWRLFYADGLRAGYWNLETHHEQAFEDELQANQYFHQLRSEWLQETPVVG